MATSPMLGFVPLSASLVLSAGANFSFVLSIAPAVFPENTEVWIAWQNAAQTQWSASVQSSTAEWDVSYTQTTAAIVPAGTLYYLYVSYPDGSGTDNFLWYYGYATRME